MNPNSLKANILVTALTLVMVFLLPYLDRKICAKLGVSLDDSLGSSSKADRYLHIRKNLLFAMFAVYVLLILYVAFFSRSAADDYTVHVALYEDLANSIKIDFGILGLIASIFKNGFKAAMQHVHILSGANISQVYMNICMFIPMGYLLPYVFDLFRKHIRRRTLLFCALATLLIENFQLITKLGFYDIDDIFSNMIGGYLGVSLYIAVAYSLANPDWKEEGRRYREWKRNERGAALVPFHNKAHLIRTTVFAKDKDAVLDFFDVKLGMYRRSSSEEGKESSYLFELGTNQIELKCSPSYVKLPSQNVTLACNNSEKIKKRIEKCGLEVSGYSADPYTGLRTFSVPGPGNITVTIIEE